jgi:alpha,alpha-trehalose phosphorylase
VQFRGRRLRVTVHHDRADYELVAGPDVSFSHYGDAVRLSAGETVTVPIPEAPHRPRPVQPPGRVPFRRSVARRRSRRGGAGAQAAS